MRRSTMIALGFTALLTAGAASPALAGYGALAHEDGGKYGLSANEETQSKADDVAMKICGVDKCKVIFQTKAKECGAIATGENNAWGGGKHPQRARAELAALQNCQKHTKGQCKVRGAECNK